MKHRLPILLTFLIMLLMSPAWAMEHYTDSLQDERGRAIGGASISVYNAGTSTLSTIYSDNGVTPKANPFTSNALDGTFDFYAANGVYDLVFRHPEKTFDDLLTRRISLLDVVDLSMGGSATSPIPSGASFPGSPVSNYQFILTSASVAGLCDEGGGSAITLCRYNGSTWLPLGGGGTESQGLDDVIALDRTYGGAVSAATGPRFGSSATGRYWIPYDDPTDGLQWVCEVAGVLNDCNYNRKLAAGKKFEITNSSGTAILTLTESTGALTNVTLNAESTGNTITIQEEHWWDVVACQESTASHIWNTITATFPAAACDTGSNTQKGYASFDATTDEAIQMDWVLPTGFTGAIDVHFIWKAAATSGAVGWCAQLIRVADASTSDPAFPAQAAGNCVSDTAKGTTLQENHATITGVTCSSCAARDHVYVRISRDANGGAVTDDMTGDAHLMKVGRTWRVAK